MVTVNASVMKVSNVECLGGKQSSLFIYFMQLAFYTILMLYNIDDYFIESVMTTYV